jgi:hypothetical protein
MTASVLSRDTGSVRVARARFSSPKGDSALSFISTKARIVNHGWTLVPPTIYAILLLPIRIHFSDPLILQGSKAPNQPDDGL